jgi:hypothetical protein
MKKISLVDAFHGKHPWLDRELHDRPWGPCRRGNRWGGRRAGGMGWLHGEEEGGAMGEVVWGGKLGPVMLVRLLCCVCFSVASVRKRRKEKREEKRRNPREKRKKRKRNENFFLAWKFPWRKINDNLWSWLKIFFLKNRPNYNKTSRLIFN